MASDTVADHSSEEVEKELKPEVKILEPVQVCPPKERVNSTEPEEVPAPVATSAESGAKVEEIKTEPIVTENIKGIDTDENPKAEESVGLVKESDQKNENKQIEVPPGEEEKKIEDASDNNDAEVEKVPHPEPDENSVSEESNFEKIEGEPKEKLDTETVEKQEESEAEPSVEEKLGEPEKVVEVLKQPLAKRAAREYIGNVEVLPDKEMEESEAELAKVEKAEENKDELEKIVNTGDKFSNEGETEKKLDAKTVEKQEETKAGPSVEEKLYEPEKVVEVSKQLPALAAREYIGNVEVLPDEELEESEAELAKAEEKKDELEKIINVEEQSSIEGETEEKLDSKTVVEESKVKPAAEEKLGEPEKVVEVLKQLPAKRAAREYIGDVEVLPDEELEESEAEFAKVEKAEEKKDELEKIINAGEQSSIEAIEEKVENVEKNHDEQVETIEEKEVKGPESKPEEISEIESVEKLEQSIIESVEEKPEEPGETVQVPKKSSVDPVEDKVEILEELPVKEVEVIVEKEVPISEAESAEKLEEFKVESVDEKVDKQTKTIEPFSVETIEEIVEKTLPAKVEETAVKEVDDSETEIKPEEISKTKSVEPVEKISVDPVKIVDDPEQSSVKEKVEELPAKDVEADVEKKVIVPESVFKHTEFSDAEPSEKPEEKQDELPEEKPDEPKEIVEAVEEEDKSTEKVVELLANIVEDKEAKVLEVESKPEEISETNFIESVEEKSVELEKIVDVQVQASVLEKLREAEEFPAKDMEAIEDKEPEKIPETEPNEKLEGLEVASVEEKPDESIKIAYVQEQSSPEIDKDKIEKGVEFPTKEVEAISEKENEVPEAEFKHEEISEIKPAEKQDESKLELVEENLNEPTEIVDVPEQSVKEEVEEKVGNIEEVPTKEVDETAEDAVKVSEYENKPEEINETKPVETTEEKPVGLEKIVDVAEQSSDEVVEEKVEELSAKDWEAPVEKEVKVIEAEIKPEEISEFTPEEKLIEQSEVTEQSEKEPPPAKPVEKEAKILEGELKPEEISESTPKEKLVKQSEVTEQSEKEAPAFEPVELSKVEDLAEKVEETELSNKEEPTILEVEKVSEKNDAPIELKKSFKMSWEIDPLPEEKVLDSGKTELETETQEGKSVTTRELTLCEEAKPTESETNEKAENGNTKNEAEVEGNGDEESTKEAEKRDDETTKTDVQTETAHESEVTKAPENACKEEVLVKSTHKHSNNIMKMVKHSLVKAKKAIVGKSANSKAPVPEIKSDEVSK